MKNLIKYFLILFFIPNISFSTDSSSEKIIFKVNNKAFVTSDLEDRNKYYKLLLNDEYYNHDKYLIREWKIFKNTCELYVNCSISKARTSRGNER